VSVGVADWLVGRLLKPGSPTIESERMESVDRWPTSAYGENGCIWKYDASFFPIQKKYRHLTDLLRKGDVTPLSKRATKGFFSRTQRASLRFDPDFIRDLDVHISFLEDAEADEKSDQPSVVRA
jgi:DNA (cytosine-5)-methyltransferase 1